MLSLSLYASEFALLTPSKPLIAKCCCQASLGDIPENPAEVPLPLLLPAEVPRLIPEALP
jgi:hypothetical protein